MLETDAVITLVMPTGQSTVMVIEANTDGVVTDGQVTWSWAVSSRDVVDHGSPPVADQYRGDLLLPQEWDRFMFLAEVMFHVSQKIVAQREEEKKLTGH